MPVNRRSYSRARPSAKPRVKSKTAAPPTASHKTEAGALTKNKIISELTRSTHGDLKAYVPVGLKAAESDPEFLGHLIAWNEKNGQIRDSKVALPMISLLRAQPWILEENSLAHVALLDPRNLVKAVMFGKDLHEQRAAPSYMSVRRVVERYLRVREDNWGWWERTAVQHRVSLKTLYALHHIKPSAPADQILFKRSYPHGTIFEAIATLKNMSPVEAAGTILERKIPFLVAIGALGDKAKDSTLVMALIERMSPTELTTSTKMLEKLGLKDNPALRAAYADGLKKAAVSKKTSFKAGRAAEAVQDEGLKEKLHGLQEKQIKALGGVDGNWLVLGDKSGSMAISIEVARKVAATLAKMVKGQVHLVFFDTSPRYIDATGLDYDQLLRKTALIQADGGTSIGCGLRYAEEHGFEIDGIAVVSDAEENTIPYFGDVYDQWAKKNEKTPPVYLYRTTPSAETIAKARSSMAQRYGSFGTTLYGSALTHTGEDSMTPRMTALGYDVQVFELGEVDYYSLPNLVATMKTQRYGLVDQIMETPLLTLDEVFRKREVGVTR